MLQDYGTEVIRFPSGERLPLLVHRETGMPQEHVADYSLAFHRGVPINTSRRAVDAIGMFHSWADSRRINLDERFGSGNLFTSDETTALAEALWHCRTLGRQSASVVGDTHGHRVDQVRAYITWRVSLIISSLPVQDNRIGNINDRLRLVADQLASLKGSSVAKPRGQLTEDQWLRLFEIVKPGSAENPFRKSNQLRNFFVLLLYHELGVRKSEHALSPWPAAR